MSPRVDALVELGTGGTVLPCPLVEQPLGASFALAEVLRGVTRGCDTYHGWAALAQVPERLQICLQVMQEDDLPWRECMEGSD